MLPAYSLANGNRNDECEIKRMWRNRPLGAVTITCPTGSVMSPFNISGGFISSFSGVIGVTFMMFSNVFLNYTLITIICSSNDFVWAIVFLLCFQWDYSSVQHWLLPILAVRELPFQTLYSIRRLWNSCLATPDYPPTKTKTHTNVGSISKRKAVLWQNTANVKLFPPTCMYCISKSWNKTSI